MSTVVFIILSFFSTLISESVHSHFVQAKSAIGSDYEANSAALSHSSDLNETASFQCYACHIFGSFELLPPMETTIVPISFHGWAPETRVSEGEFLDPPFQPPKLVTLLFLA